MKNFKKVLLIGAMFLNVSALAQEVTGGVGLNITNRIRGTTDGLDAKAGVSGESLSCDLNYTTSMSGSGMRLRKEARIATNVSVNNGNAAMSLGFSGVHQWESGYVMLAFSPILNAYSDRSTGLLWMPAASKGSFQTVLSDWLDVEGSVEAGWVKTRGLSTNDCQFVQGTGRIQANFKIGEGEGSSEFFLSPYAVYNGRKVLDNPGMDGIDNQGIITAGLAVKVAL